MTPRQYGEALATIGAGEAARLLGTTKHTVYRWVREGKLPAIRLNRSVRFRVSALLEWMEEQERQALKDA